MNFKARSQEKEIMDLEPLTYEESISVYKLIAGVNQYLGGNGVILDHLNRFSRKWKPGQTISILDIGSGGADIPKAVAEWFREKKQPVQITALDLNLEALRMAENQIKGYPEVTGVQGSCFDLPFAANSFDYVISSMFFHHLSDDDAVRALKAFDQIARRGIVINDLVRCRRAFWGIKLLAAFTGNRIFQNDAPLSVLRGYAGREAESLIERSGLSYLKFYRHFAYRFALAGER